MRMPLILAIEPDRRQAAKITTLVRTQLEIELVVADSTELALETIARRVPDLILTSFLLSRKDEALLTDRLRELDTAGTRVPTLVVPVLGAPRRSRSQKGLLTRLRGGQDGDASTDGCDPAVFGAQIAEYLERAAAERLAAAVVLEDQMAAMEDSVYDTRLEAERASRAPQPTPASPWHEEAFQLQSNPAGAVHIEEPPPIPADTAHVEEPPPPSVKTARVEEMAPLPVKAEHVGEMAPPAAETIGLAAFVEELEATAPSWQAASVHQLASPQHVVPPPAAVAHVEQPPPGAPPRQFAPSSSISLASPIRQVASSPAIVQAAPPRPIAPVRPTAAQAPTVRAASQRPLDSPRPVAPPPATAQQTSLRRPVAPARQDAASLPAARMASSRPVQASQQGAPSRPAAQATPSRPIASVRPAAPRPPVARTVTPSPIAQTATSRPSAAPRLAVPPQPAAAQVVQTRQVVPPQRVAQVEAPRQVSPPQPVAQVAASRQVGAPPAVVAVRVSPRVEPRPEPVIARGSEPSVANSRSASRKAPGLSTLGDVLTALKLDLVQMRTEPAAALGAAPPRPSPVSAAPNHSQETGSSQELTQHIKREHGTAPLHVEKRTAPLHVEKRTAPLPVEKGTAPAPQEKASAPVPREKESTPVQDEWGFFDPQQCGFSALLTKLEEISEDEKRSAKKRA